MNYRRIFLEGYSYYLTLVTQGRKPLLIDNIDLLRDAFRRSKERYDYDIEAIVILPDHIHMIIKPKIPKEYSKIIKHVKRSFVYGLDQETKAEAKTDISYAKYHRGHAGIWQERFYEHMIRDEKDWLEKMEYIRSNPVKHGYIEDINDWEYSSFYRRSVSPMPT
ncbi:MAG: transposase [Campylobacterota bacterium]|nr:transposase [Campylobacterota bacterium]